MEMDELKETDGKHLFQNYSRQEICFSHGKGEALYGLDGREYIDLVAGIAVNSLGHAHPAMTAAVCDQSSRLVHVSNLYLIKEQAELAETLARIAPGDLERSLFVNSGAEANEAAMKLAVRRSGRCKVVTVEGSFHGRTCAALKATGQTKYQEGFEALMSDFAVHVPLNDVDALNEAVDKDTAALLLEPILGEGGVRPCSEEFLRAARDICDDRGALLIVDEVQTGMGRTGEWFGFQHYGVQPDVVTMAKGLGGGFPIGCMMSSDDLSKALPPGTHGTTFGGGPLACAAASAVVRTIEEDGLVARAASLGAEAMKSLQQLEGEYLKEVRGKGLMIGLDMPGHAKALQARALEEGFLVNVCADSVVRLVPPLIVSQSSLQKFTDIVKGYLDEI